MLVRQGRVICSCTDRSIVYKYSKFIGKYRVTCLYCWSNRTRPCGVTERECVNCTKKFKSKYVTSST